MTPQAIPRPLTPSPFRMINSGQKHNALKCWHRRLPRIESSTTKTRILFMQNSAKRGFIQKAGEHLHRTGRRGLMEAALAKAMRAFASSVISWNPPRTPDKQVELLFISFFLLSRSAGCSKTVGRRERRRWWQSSDGPPDRKLSRYAQLNCSLFAVSYSYFSLIIRFPERCQKYLWPEGFERLRWIARLFGSDIIGMISPNY